jgi:chemosensory pili system protein ChpA (sensor histidine kinase/response regulator)
MAGAMVAGELAHGMETRVEALEISGGLAGSLDELQSTFDRFGVMLDELRQAPVQAQVEPAMHRSEEKLKDTARAVLRVRADVVDRLVNQAGEVSVARSRIEGEVRTLRGALSDLTDNVIRLRAQLRDIEIQAETQLQSSVSRDAEGRFDPLEFDRFTRFQELTRGMAESVNDVATLQQALLKAIDQSESALLNQGRLSRELQDGLMSVRMVPFSSVAERLHRVVRQSAKELGKRASLQISGAQTELDRSVLERMSAPFEHLLRNALAHGIEPAALRRAQGKSEVGEIVIELRHDGNEAHIEVRDDGGGLDLDAIRRRALERGLIEADAQWSDRQLAELIFLPGFTTAADVTLAAGRGVGMDVVKNEVSALGGRIDLEFERGRGTRFIIRLPLALGVKRSLLMEVGKRIYALPVQIIEHVMTVKTELMQELYQTRVAQWQGNRYPFHYLPHLLGIAAVPAPARRSVSVLMLRSGAERLALQVDRIVGIQELVSKRLGAQLESLVGINGAAVLGTGQVVLFVNPVELAARATAQARAIAHAADAAAGQRRQRLVLVVDDSLTVRKVTGRLLNRAGYEVISAKDGVDAVNQLKSVTPDIMLVDIEMPRMDGFELTKHVRATSTLAAIPIIMVTSRDADKHRSYAFELGVNAFLGKPYQEEELLANITRFLEPAERARAA